MGFAVWHDQAQQMAVSSTRFCRLGLPSLGRCSEGHLCSQWWETNLFKGQDLLQFPTDSVADSCPGNVTALARKRQEGTVCLCWASGYWHCLAQEGSAQARISYLKLLRIVCMLIATLQKLSQNLYLHCLACSPCGFKHTRRTLEDLDVV